MIIESPSNILSRCDFFLIEKGAVQGLKIYQNVIVRLFLLDLRVMARYGHVVNDNVVIFASADGDRSCIECVLP